MRNTLSLLALTAVLILYLFSFFRYKQARENVLFGGDQWGYYVYLPAFFIYGDLNNIETTYHERKKNGGDFSLVQNTESIAEAPHSPIQGNRVIKYTMGLALLQTPFFLVAHYFAEPLGYPANGYSPPYMVASQISLLCWVLLGLWLLRQILLQFFSDNTAAISLFIVGAGTNLYYFSTQLMAHGYLFSFWAILIYAVLKFYETHRYKYAVLMGFSTGFIILIRPVEIIAVLLPLLYGVYNKNTAKARFYEIVQHFKKYILAAFVAFIILLPQFIYWKYTTGFWLFYSYPGEVFYFNNPQIINGLFSFSNGWLAYTPLMAAAVLGCFGLGRQHFRNWGLPIVLILLLHIYIIYSWWCWNYINGLGSRPMVDIYALLAVPLAVFIQAVNSKKWLKWIFTPLVSFLVFLNVFQVEQVYRGVLFSESGNLNYYKGIFMKLHLDYYDLVQFDCNEMQPDSNYLQKVAVLKTENFEDSTTAFYSTDRAFSGKGACWLKDKDQQSQPLKISALQVKPGNWLKISAVAQKKHYGSNIYSSAKLVFEIRNTTNNKKIRGKDIRLDNKLTDKDYNFWNGDKDVWHEVYFWVKIPQSSVFEPQDSIFVYAKQFCPLPVGVDDMKVEEWTQKTN